MTSGAPVQVGRPPLPRGFDGAAVPKGRFDPEPPWTPEERRIHVQECSEPHRLQADLSLLGTRCPATPNSENTTVFKRFG